MAMLSVYVAGLLLSAVVCAGVAVLAVRQRPKTGALSLAGLLAAGVLWAGAAAGAVLAETDGLAITFQGLTHVAEALVVVAFFAFALEYAGRSDVLTPRTGIALALEPAIVLAAVFTNPESFPFWADIYHASSGAVIWAGGPIFWLHVLYSYLVLAIGMTVLMRTAILARNVDQRLFVVLTVALLLPVMANLLSLFGPTEVALTPMTLAVAGGALYIAMDRYDLTDLTPIARNTLVDVIDDAILVVDENDRIIDVNAAFEGFVDESASQLLGADLESAFADRQSLLDALAADGEDVVEIDTPDGLRDVRVHVSEVDHDSADVDGTLYVLHDVTAQHRYQQELERQNEQLEQFASLISHDLRNPLDVAMGRATVLGELLEDDDLQEHVDEIELAHERMRRIIDDVLALARQGQNIDETEPVDLGELSTEAWSHVDTGEADLTVETDVDMLADRSRLAQLLENLFRNAVQHAGEDVTVTVGALEAPGFYVADDGVGIPPEKREEVLEAGVTDHDDGTGLGLSIVTNIAEAHGWEVAVTASTDGGARFEFTGLELADEPAARAP